MTGLTANAAANHDVKVVSNGKTYDDKLYIFDELDYETEFQYLEIIAKKLMENAFAVPDVGEINDQSNSSVSISNDGSQSNKSMSIDKNAIPGDGNQNNSQKNNQSPEENNCMAKSSRSNL